MGLRQLPNVSSAFKPPSAEIAPRSSNPGLKYEELFQKTGRRGNHIGETEDIAPVRNPSILGGETPVRHHVGDLIQKSRTRQLRFQSFVLLLLTHKHPCFTNG